MLCFNRCHQQTVGKGNPIPHNILLISDAADAGTVRDALLKNSEGLFDVHWVRSRADGLARLTRTAFPNLAAVLAELELPDSSGLDTFAQLHRAAPQIPLLILTDTQHEAVARIAMRQGAHDYFLKGHRDDWLLAKALHTIIERHAFATLLIDEQDRARAALDAIGDAVISTDLDLRVTYLNSVAEKMTGWKRHEAHGQRVDEVFRGIDGATGEQVREAMELAMRDQAVTAFDPVADGEVSGELALEDSAVPIYNRQGEVIGALMIFRDMGTSRTLSNRLLYLAQHDSLTGLPNRVLLHDRLSHAVSLAHRRRTSMAVLFLDIDRFKHVNDSLGHVIGDRLLQAVARRLLSCVRRSDTVSRRGGDELVILLSEINQPQDAALSAEKVLQALAVPYQIDQHELRVTGSIGIVVYPDDGSDADMLLKHADVAMYHAKDQGRNNYQFFEPDLNARALERQVLESGLRRAIESRELLLHYQPKVDLKSGAIVGAEAFVRWLHPERGLILPAQFVPIAETCGSMIPIGRWVLREACRQACAWRADGLAMVKVAVNVSPGELRDRDFLHCVERILDETGLDPANLELEVRETSLLQDSQHALEVLNALKAMRVQLALDDFGTGYSSLSLLRNFPIDILKIDGSFVRDLGTDSGTDGIVGAVIGMGRNLRMEVVAEGVESREQLTGLRELACPQAQGFYFSEPLTAAEFSRLCHRWEAQTASVSGASTWQAAG